MLSQRELALRNPNHFGTFVQLKHGAPELAIPAKPTALELRLRRESRRLRLLRHNHRRREEVTARGLGGDVEGEEIDGGGIRGGARKLGEGDLMAEDGVGLDVVGEGGVSAGAAVGGGGGEGEGAEGFVEEGFGDRRVLLLLHY